MAGSSAKWFDTELLLDNTKQAIGASETDTIVSEEFTIDNPEMIIIDIQALQSQTTVATGITAKLQVSSAGRGWVDSKTVSIADNADWYTIKIHPNTSSDDAFLPLRKRGRVVVSSGSGDSTRIDSVIVTRGG